MYSILESRMLLKNVLQAKLDEGIVQEVARPESMQLAHRDRHRVPGVQQVIEQAGEVSVPQI